MSTQNLCIYPGEWLLPAQGVDLTSWACVACDQYTAQPKYWEDVKLLVGDKPSTLQLILPECYLDQADTRIAQIHQAMRRDLDAGVLVPAVQNGFILTERSTGSGARVGLVVLVDLECYDFTKGSQSLIRATEETISSRIPPRLRVRQNAALETSHVLMLMDDPMQTVVEPLFDRRDELPKLYDFPLMQGGGHLTGYAVSRPADIAQVYQALDALRAQLPSQSPLLFAVGDGNHSLATAKAAWEEIKKTLTPAQTTTHPARFAMVELENIHDDALAFEPIHRVLFGYDGDDLLCELSAYAAAKGTSVADEQSTQEVLCVYEGKEVALNLCDAAHQLAVAALQAFLDEWLTHHPHARLDYVHGADVVRRLVAGEGAIGFLLPKPEKSALFPTVISDGALPRKTFSLGQANEKRFYMECRRL
ncbi:MAG: DUF1015 domain-containing protein [Clostridia bacterium]